MTAKRITFAVLAALAIGATPALAVSSQLFVIINSKLTPVGDGTGGSVAMPVSGGSSGVSTWNGRTGSVVLLGSDITGAGGMLGANNLSDLVNPAIARANILAAASGNNSDITQITGLTTALTPAQGGTGVANSFTIQLGGNLTTASAVAVQSLATANRVLTSGSGNQIASIASTASALFQTNGSGVPGWSTSLPSGISITSPAISGGTLSSPGVSGGTFSGGTFNSPTINSPTITGLTLSSPGITGVISGSPAASGNWSFDGQVNFGGQLVTTLFETCEALGTDGSGNVFCNNPFSDRRLKTDLGPLDTTKAMLALDTIQVHQYSFKPGEHFEGGKAHYGFFAQDVQPLFPELVTTHKDKQFKDGALMFDRQDFIAVLWKQNQALRAEQMEQATRLATLEKMNRELVALLPKSVRLVTASRGH